MLTLGEGRRDYLPSKSETMDSKTISICLLQKFRIRQVNRMSNNAAERATDFYIVSTKSSYADGLTYLWMSARVD